MVQEILVGVLVLAALGFLGWKFLGKSKKQPGCDKCAKN
ncbi:FeoB-associated Cys-rich membrane protein [Algoriphagus machipongonensis]|nr:FeoB-associated Cys-rich membrane protein [Algoriphagus machipongonensis]